MVYVSWNDAITYAKWAGKRLPTEAEWEKADREGLVGRKYPSGDKEPDGSQCNFFDEEPDDGYRYSAPVGHYSPNGYGLFDLAGNVWEWCSDWYDRNYYANSPPNNPSGPNNASFRVFRGGS